MEWTVKPLFRDFRFSGMEIGSGKGHISDDGNKIIIDNGEKAGLTLIRK